MIAIKTSNLTRHFGSKAAVDHLNLEVPEATIFGFLGPNGAGKTTTLYLLLGLLEPSEGTAEVLGFDCSSQSDQVRKHTGVVFEQAGLYDRLTVMENLEFFARISRLPARLRTSRLHDLLEQFSLWDKRDQIVSTLSHGMRHSLALARAFVHKPKLAILDEPTSGLDPIAAARLHDGLIAYCRTEGATVFLTTHNLFEAEKICPQVAIIANGRLLAQGTIAQLRVIAQSHRIEVTGRSFNEAVIAGLRVMKGVTSIAGDEGRLMLELDPSTDLASVSRAIINCGGSVEELRRVGSSLENVFSTLLQGEE